MSSTIFMAIFLGLFGVFVVVYLVLARRREKAWRKRIQETRQKLLAQGFKIANGIVHSPTVIVKTEGYDEFLSFCQILGTTTVYQEFSRFYTFTKDWQIGYRLKIEYEEGN